MVRRSTIKKSDIRGKDLVYEIKAKIYVPVDNPGDIESIFDRIREYGEVEVTNVYIEDREYD